MKDFFDKDPDSSSNHDSAQEQADSRQQTDTAADQIACPVCHKPVGLPIPELCPSCQAPIQSIMAVLNVADLAIQEAMRDLRIGDIDSVSRRLALVRVSSKAHRLRAEVIQAMLDRLKGNPSAALARIRAVRDQMKELPDPDDELAILIEETEAVALDDQAALASCCELYNFALFQAKRGHLEEARDAALRALGYVPHHGPSHLLLAKTYFALKENVEARYHLTRALAIDPSDVSASRLLARMNKSSMLNPMEWLAKSGWLTSRWTGPVVVVILLIILGLAAFLNR